MQAVTSVDMTVVCQMRRPFDGSREVRLAAGLEVKFSQTKPLQKICQEREIFLFETSWCFGGLPGWMLLLLFFWTCSYYN